MQKALGFFFAGCNLFDLYVYLCYNDIVTDKPLFIAKLVGDGLEIGVYGITLILFTGYFIWKWRSKEKEKKEQTLSCQPPEVNTNDCEVNMKEEENQILSTHSNEQNEMNKEEINQNQSNDSKPLIPIENN